jgi:DNA repair protein RecN (Recombination protein N)
MLSRLQVRELGVIVALDVDLESGLTAITGETGAGKTLIVEALDLLCGGRADATMVRAGAEEAVVEALFVDDGEEHLVSRTVPRSGRSRATIDGNLATVAMLEQFSDERVDLHGQHAHQSLLRQAVQRNALDRFAGVDLSDVMALRAQQKEIDDALLRLGGDDATRSRELDLLQFEVDEIERAHIESNDELERLAEEELLLAATTSLREATSAASELLDGSTRDGAVDLIGAAIAQLAAHSHLEGYEARLRAIQAELVDAQSEIHRAAESFEEDPTRQEFVRGRQEMLRRLVRKHGSDLCDVNKFAAEAHIRIDELSSSEDLRRQLNDDREKIKKQLEVAEQKVGDQRRAFAPNLARAVEGHLHDLALLHARVEIHVGESGIGDDVEFRLGANPGEPALSLSKVAWRSSYS